VRKQEGQVFSIAILSGHGVGDVTDIDIKQHRCKRWPLRHSILQKSEAAALPIAVVLRMKLRFEIISTMKRIRYRSGIASVSSPDARQCQRPQWDPQGRDLPYVFLHSSLQYRVSLTICWTVQRPLRKLPCWVGSCGSTTGCVGSCGSTTGSSRNRRRRSSNLYGTQRSEIGLQLLGSSIGLFDFGTAMSVAFRQIFGMATRLSQLE